MSQEWVAKGLRVSFRPALFFLDGSNKSCKAVYFNKAGRMHDMLNRSKLKKKAVEECNNCAGHSIAANGAWGAMVVKKSRALFPERGSDEIQKQNFEAWPPPTTERCSISHPVVAFGPQLTFRGERREPGPSGPRLAYFLWRSNHPSIQNNEQCHTAAEWKDA